MLSKIKHAETDSEVVKCLKSIERVSQCKIFTIRDNNDDYIDIETDRYIAEITTIFCNRCKCKISRERYEDNLRRVIMIIHYRMERIGGYRLDTKTHRFFRSPSLEGASPQGNETINRTRMSREAIEV